MKKPLLFAVMLAIILAGAFMYLSSAHARFEIVEKQSENEDAGEPETDDPEAALRQEFIMTHDPHTNTIPRERLFIAMEYYARLATIAATAKGTGITNYSTIGWTERGPTAVGGRTRSILFDANDATNKRVFAGSVGGGIWRCEDITLATPVWTPVNDQLANLAVTCIAQDPAAPATIYFGTGEGWYNSDGLRGGGIWKSTNGGSTFTRLTATANNSDFDYIQKLIVTSSGLYAACRSRFCNAGGLMRSTDGGVTFSRVLGTPTGSCATSIDLNAADVEVASNGDLYASTGIFSTGKIWRSSTGATAGNSGTWINITPSGTFQRIELAVAPTNSARVYAMCQGSGNEVSSIFTTANSGTSWTACTLPTNNDCGTTGQPFSRGQAWYDLSMAVDSTNEQVVLIGAINYFRTANAGSTWTQITDWCGAAGLPNVHSDHHTFVFRPGSSGAVGVCGCDGGIYYASGLTGTPAFSNRNNSYNVTQYYATATHPTNANYALAGAQDNGSEKFTVAGLNSGVSVSGGDGAFCWISKTNGNNQITSYVYNNFYRSTNGGTSFSTVTGGTNTGQFINPGDLDNTNGILYTAGASNQLVRWAGIFGTVVRTNLTVAINSTLATAVSVSPNDPTTVYLGTSQGNIYRIANANATPAVTQIATALGGTSAGTISSINIWKKVVGATDDSIVVSLSNYGVESVYLSGNATAATPTWTDIDDNSTLQDIPVRWAAFSPVNNKIIFIATEVGVMGSSVISGATTPWVALNNNTLPMVSTDMIQFNSNQEMVVATHGRGLWTSTTVTPLPLRLVSFDAGLAADDVLLSWEMADEHDAAHYTVERMYSNEPHFAGVGQVMPQQIKSYSWRDVHPDWKRGPVLYRLRIEDVSGNLFYSSTRRIGHGAENALIYSVSPTITDDAVQIKTGNANTNAMNILVVNTAGQVLQRQQLPYQDCTVRLGGYAPGVYYVAVIDASGMQKQIFTIQKK